MEGRQVHLRNSACCCGLNTRESSVECIDFLVITKEENKLKRKCNICPKIEKTIWSNVKTL